jgi:hypothetical protein
MMAPLHTLPMLTQYALKGRIMKNNNHTTILTHLFHKNNNKIIYRLEIWKKKAIDFKNSWKNTQMGGKKIFLKVGHRIIEIKINMEKLCMCSNSSHSTSLKVRTNLNLYTSLCTKFSLNTSQNRNINHLNLNTYH